MPPIYPLKECLPVLRTILFHIHLMSGPFKESCSTWCHLQTISNILDLLSHMICHSYKCTNDLEICVLNIFNANFLQPHMLCWSIHASCIRPHTRPFTTSRHAFDTQECKTNCGHSHHKTSRYWRHLRLRFVGRCFRNHCACRHTSLQLSYCHVHWVGWGYRDPLLWFWSPYQEDE